MKNSIILLRNDLKLNQITLKPTAIGLKEKNLVMQAIASKTDITAKYPRCLQQN